jgi:enamine deaminase RidA (YjgF/YER057c/UK114 family)
MIFKIQISKAIVNVVVAIETQGHTHRSHKAAPHCEPFILEGSMVHSNTPAFAPSSPAIVRHFAAPIHSFLPMVQIEKQLVDAGIKIPPAPVAAANYTPCQRSGNLLFLSGHLPLKEDGTLMTGCVAGPGDVETGYAAARQVGLNLIATLKNQLGDLDRVEQIVKVFGIVQSADNFHEQHKVVNGCSDLFIRVFGKEKGLHARSAIGTNALPLNIMVEIEAIVRIKD